MAAGLHGVADDVIAIIAGDEEDVQRCLAALAAQVASPAAQLVIGSAGTRHRAVAVTHATRNHAWVWLLDPAPAPEPEALAQLRTAASATPAALYASLVCDGAGDPDPAFLPRPGADLPQFLDDVAHGLVPIRSASSCSLLISSDAIGRHGPPAYDPFGHLVGREFTFRVLSADRGFLVSASRARAPLVPRQRMSVGTRRALAAIKQLRRSGALSRREVATEILETLAPVQLRRTRGSPTNSGHYV